MTIYGKHFLEESCSKQWKPELVTRLIFFNSAEGMGKANFTAEKQIHSEEKKETK